MAVLMARVDAMAPLTDEDLDAIADILAAVELRAPGSSPEGTAGGDGDG